MMDRARRGIAVSAVLGLLGVTAPRTASAFVRYRTSTNEPYSWRTTTVAIKGYPYGLPSMTVDEITTAMTAAVGAWSKEDPTNALCSYLGLALTMRPVSVAPPSAVRDNVNTIAIRDGRWTAICSTSRDGKTVCHQSGELALTTVWSRVCGEIVEADVEVNADQTAGGSGFMWADLDVAAAGSRAAHDLQNALTHEMGHFIGLDHTCALNGLYPTDDTGNPIIPTDNLGNPVPSCDDLPAEDPALRPTMYPSAEAGDTDKRTLADDDHQGLCDIYPLGTSPVACGEASGGCAIAPLTDGRDGRESLPSSRWRWLAGGLLGAATVLVASRRGRARNRQPPG